MPAAPVAVCLGEQTRADIQPWSDEAAAVAGTVKPLMIAPAKSVSGATRAG